MGLAVIGLVVVGVAARLGLAVGLAVGFLVGGVVLPGAEVLGEPLVLVPPGVGAALVLVVGAPVVVAAGVCDPTDWTSFDVVLLLLKTWLNTTIRMITSAIVPPICSNRSGRVSESGRGNGSSGW
jgi:hypothetical protein